MDKRDAINKAKLYADLLFQNFDTKQVFVFGSYAKNNYNEDSDIDIAVVFNDYDDLMEMQLRLMRLRRKIDSRIEPHPFREKDFNLSNPMVNEILKYGQEIKKVA